LPCCSSSAKSKCCIKEFLSKVCANFRLTIRLTSALVSVADFFLLALRFLLGVIDWVAIEFTSVLFNLKFYFQFLRYCRPLVPALLRVAVTESQSHEFYIAGRQLEFSQVGARFQNIVPGTCLEQGMTFGQTQMYGERWYKGAPNKLAQP